MFRIILAILLVLTTKVYSQNFQSVDTDTLYEIYDYGIRKYDFERERIEKESDFISSNKIKTLTKIKVSKYHNNNISEFKKVSHYDIRGLKQREVWWSNGKLMRNIEFDKFGNSIKVLGYKKDTIVEKMIREFDQFGNLIYDYKFKNDNEKVEVNSQLLANGDRLITYYTKSNQNTFIFDSSGLIQEFTVSYKKRPKINGHKRISRGVKIDTVFESDSGDYLERQVFSYTGNKLTMIETFEEYERYLNQRTYTYQDDKTFSIDTNKWVDNGGLKNIRIFKYSNDYLTEFIDSTIKHRSEIYRTRYYYDNLGRIVQKRMYVKSNNQDKLIQTFKVEYDSYGNIVHKSYIFKSSLYWQRKYSYDENNNLTYYSYGTDKPIIESYYTYKDLGIITTKKTLTHTCLDCEYFDEEMAKSYPLVNILSFDENGNIIEQAMYKSNNVLTENNIAEYKDSLVISKKTLRDNVEVYHSNFNYDENGLLIFEQNQDFKRDSETKINYLYEYFE